MSGRPRVALLPLGAAAVLAGLAVLTSDAWLLLLAGAVAGLLVTAVVLRPRLEGLVLAQTGPAQVVVGDEPVYRLVLRNGSSHATAPVRVTLSAPGLADVAVLVPGLPPGVSAEVAVVRPAVERAAASPGEAVLVSSAPLGLVRAQRVLRVEGNVTVRPRTWPVPLPAGAGDGSDATRAVVSRSGLDVHGVRDFRPGDDHQRVHWRSTARRGRLVVLEREQPVGGLVAVVVAGSPAAPDWEDVVSAAASTAVSAVREGRRTLLVARQPGLADLPTTDAGAVLDWCAALASPTPPSREELARVLAAVGAGGVLQVAATAGYDPAWWSWARGQAYGHGVSLVPLGPASGPS